MAATSKACFFPTTSKMGNYQDAKGTPSQAPIAQGSKVFLIACH